MHVRSSNGRGWKGGRGKGSVVPPVLLGPAVIPDIDTMKPIN